MKWISEKSASLKKMQKKNVALKFDKSHIFPL